MPSDTLETQAHTTPDGLLRLNLDVGIPDADVTVTVRVTPSKSKGVDSNGWPIGYFEELAGSMPDLTRSPQGEFEQRTPLA